MGKGTRGANPISREAIRESSSLKTVKERAAGEGSASIPERTEQMSP